MSTKIITNKMAKPCSSCKAPVAIGAGYAATKGQGWLTICASTACFDSLGFTHPGSNQRRELNVRGEIRMPKDSAALPLLRSIPGARWNPDLSAWTVSLDVKDRERLLEVADQLSLEVAPELRVYDLPEETIAAQSRALHPDLFPFQRTGVEFLSLHPRAVLGDDMGLGKTVQALCALPESCAAIVVCPASVKYNWRDEIKRWRPDLIASVLSGKASFRVPAMGEVVIINFDVLPAWLAAFGERSQAQLAPVPIGFELIGDCRLIVDEAHAVKNYKALRSKRVAGLSKLCAGAWFLTGTPLLNRPPDLWGVLSAAGLNFEVFGSWRRFEALFGAHTVRHGKSAHAVHTEWNGPQGPEASERLRRVMLRRMKTEVLPDLPRKQYQTITVNGISKKLLAKLDQLDAEWGEWIETTRSLPEFSEFSAVRAELAEAKIDAMIEIVESHEDSETPLIVFSAHRAPIDALESRDGWAVITGDTKPEDRQTIVRRFQAGEFKGIGLTIAAGGVGLTLTRASRVLFVDQDWTPALNAQAEDRVCRIGQTASSVQIVRLCSDHKLDKHINALLTEKIDLIEKAIDQRASYAVPRAEHIDYARAKLAIESREAMEHRKSQIEIAASVEEQVSRNQRCRALVEKRMPDLMARSLPAHEVIEGAFEFLSERCDGAVTKDGQGFNKFDAALARWVFACPEGQDRDRALFCMVYKYRRQLEAKFPELYEGTQTIAVLESTADVEARS